MSARQLVLLLSVVVLLLLLLPAVAGAEEIIVAPGHERVASPDNDTPSWTVSLDGAAQTDVAYDVVTGARGDVWLTGTSMVSGLADGFLAVVPSSRSAYTLRRWDGSAQQHDAFYDIAKGPGGVMYTVGHTQKSSGSYDAVLVKWSASGTAQWSRRLDGPAHGNDDATDVVVDRWGNVTVCVQTGTVAGNDWAVASWSSKGVKRWSWKYAGTGGGNDVPKEMVVDGGGNVYVTGWAYASGGKYAALTVKFSKSGAKRWSRSYKGSEGLNGSTNAICAAPGGGVYVAGWQARSATGWDTLLMKYTSKGARTVFAKVASDDAGSQDLYDVAVRPDGNVIVVGSSTHSANQDALAIMRTPSDQPMVTWMSLTPQTDTYTLVGADATNGVYIAGSVGNGSGHDVFVWRTPGVPGGIGWLIHWAPSASAGNYPNAMTIKGSSCFVAGTHFDAVGGWNAFVMGCEY